MFGKECKALLSEKVDKKEGKLINHFYLYDNWIYYKNPTDCFKLYRLSTTGDIQEKVMDELFHNEHFNGMFIVDSEYIYFVQPNDHYKLYRTRLDNGDKELVIDKEICNFNIDEEYIYFTDCNR